MIPIFKSEERTDPSNYRPISLLSVFDKPLEKKLMCNRLNPFFQKHNIFYKYQFGFRKNHATANALTEVIDYIYKSLDEGNYVFGIYIDLKKAFDTVQHKILLHKLQYYGIRRLAFHWFETCLSKRKQFVVINYTQSDISDLCEYGVPQGSVLVHVPNFGGLSGSEDRDWGDNSIQFINFGWVGDKSFKEWRQKIGGWKGG